MNTIREYANTALRTVGADGVVLRARDRRRARRAVRHDPHGQGPDGLPVPPAELITQVSGTPDLAEYLRSGAVGRRVIAETLARNGVVVEEVGSLLDFGVGSGRIARHWADLVDVEVHGCDYNPVHVQWCRDNLPHVHAAVNELDPPLPYAGETFDVVYALSVFTHLTEGQQVAWISELRRVLRPGGVVLFTTHGPAFPHRDPAYRSPEVRARLARGELVVALPAQAGRNACAALHPFAWVQEHMMAGFELLEYVERGAKMNGEQDLYVLRRSD